MRYSSSKLEPIERLIGKHRQVVLWILILFFLGALLVCWKVGRIVQSTYTVEQKQQTLKKGTKLAEKFSRLAAVEEEKQTDFSEAKEIDLSACKDGLWITEGGTYLLSGSLDGRITVQTNEEAVQLFLNNAQISASSGPAILCLEAKRLVLTSVQGTENTVSDSGDYRQNPDDEGCIQADCDLILNGQGTLNVYGYCLDAIHCRDVVKVLEGTLNVKCKRTGIHGSDGILVQDGKLSLSSEKNGFRTLNMGKNGKGNLVLAGGEVSVIAGRYAFVAEKADFYAGGCSVRQRSIVETYQVAGGVYLEKGCVQ